MATESIIQPGTPEAKPPLKRSTIIGVVILVLALLVAGALIAQSKGRGGSKPVADDSRLNTVGSDASIDDEASRIQVIKVPGPERPANTIALENQGKQVEKTEKTAHEQLESAGVVSRMLVMDGSTAEDRDQISPAQRQQMELARIPLPGGVVQQGAQAPKSAQESNPLIAAAIEDFRKNGNGQRTREQQGRAWLRELAEAPPSESNKAKVVKGRYVLAQGMVIPAILTRNLNSDLPGEVTARTAVDVYDSFNGFHLLIPKGSMLYGQYSSGVAVGQERLMFAFKRITLPNRVAFDLPAANGMDLSGAAGIEGDVNNHFFKMFGTSLLFALLSVGAERNEPAPSGLGSSGGARTAAGQALVDVSRTVLDRNRAIAPTITIPAGTRINVQVSTDMEFPAPYRPGTHQ